jgi:hypothetical protein
MWQAFGAVRRAVNWNRPSGTGKCWIAPQLLRECGKKYGHRPARAAHCGRRAGGRSTGHGRRGMAIEMPGRHR